MRIVILGAGFAGTYLAAHLPGRLEGLRVRGLLGWVAWKLTDLKHLLSIGLSLRAFLDGFFDI
ncbi:MAG: hypothetical protein AB1640_13790, partial [bacterium]